MLQRLQVRARGEPEAIDERSTRPLERHQRLVLPAGRVQRPHQQAPRPLPPGLLGDQPLDVANHELERATLQPGFGEVFRGRPPLHVEAHRLGGGELGGVSKADVGLTAPQVESTIEHTCGTGEVADTQTAPTFVGEGFELRSVDDGRVGRQPVPTRGRLDQLPIDTDERAAQPGDVRLDRPRRRRRRIVTPQGIHDRIDPHHLPDPARQKGKQPTAVRPGDMQQTTVVLHGQRPEHQNAHDSDRTGDRARPRRPRLGNPLVQASPPMTPPPCCSALEGPFLPVVGNTSGKPRPERRPSAGVAARWR